MMKSLRLQEVQELAKEYGFTVRKHPRKKYYIVKNEKLQKTLRFYTLGEIGEYLVKFSQRWSDLTKNQKDEIKSGSYKSNKHIFDRYDWSKMTN